MRDPLFQALDLSEAIMKQFDHEKLKVYHAAIAFVAWSSDLLSGIPKSISVHNQFDRASTSIPLNIAEGNGKYTSADCCRFFDNARGSTLECAACLDVLVAKSLDQSGRCNGREGNAHRDRLDAGRPCSIQFS